MEAKTTAPPRSLVMTIRNKGYFAHELYHILGRIINIRGTEEAHLLVFKRLLLFVVWRRWVVTTAQLLLTYLPQCQICCILIL